MSSRSVIILGGGLAGLSSGVALASAGYRVTLVEQRPFLGGRATSYVLPSGEHVDNCQHVTLGCCTNLDDFYRRAGAGGKIRYYDELIFSAPDGKRGKMRAGILPAPLHFLGAFAAFSLLNWADKSGIARLMMEIARAGGRPRDLAAGPGAVRPSMLEWLRAHKQTEAAIARFWGVVLVSALDEQLDRTDAQYGVDVFWKAFIANRAGYRIGIPTVPLADLYDGCRKAVEAAGGTVRMRSPVRGIAIEADRVVAVTLDSEEALHADYFISALPHETLLELLPAEIASGSPVFAGLRNLRCSPITSVHLWYDRSVMSEPFITLLDTTTQWIFNKSLLSSQAQSQSKDAAEPEESAPGGQYIQLVISASYDLVSQSRQDIIAKCQSEIAPILPATRDAKVLKATVIKETVATFSPEPGCDRWRPAARSPVEGLFLAGDWTATGWPATMEGAVRSGYLAAEAILEHDGDPQKLVRPDLPIEGFTKMLARRGGDAD
jgi:squalene-associated FAD-dependent desaturase